MKSPIASAVSLSLALASLSSAAHAQEWPMEGISTNADGDGVADGDGIAICRTDPAIWDMDNDDITCEEGM